MQTANPSRQAFKVSSKATQNVILITGASSGFGALAARALADAGHTVYASMRETTGRNAPQVASAQAYATEHGADLRTLELDVTSEASIDAAVAKIIADNGRLDVLVHNAGHMVFGPAEAFTPEQFAELYDINVLSTQRVNRAVIVPGAFTKGTNHFAHSGAPADKARAEEYATGPTADLPDVALKGLAALEPADADVNEVAEAIVKVVDAPFGKRPFRVHIDSSQDGCEIVNGVADRVRAELLRRIGLEDVLTPHVLV